MAVEVLIHAVFNFSGLLDCISKGDYFCGFDISADWPKT